MKTLPLIALLIAGCSWFSAAASPEDKIADANLALTLAKELGPQFVASGKIKQDELDLAVTFLDAGVKAYTASLQAHNAEAQRAARDAMLTATIKLLAMLAD